MIVQQMHIEFGLGFQKLGANSRRKFMPEEIDALFNREVDQFIKDSIKQSEDAHGFQKIQVDVDRVRPLIVRDATIKCGAFLSGLEYNGYEASLPSDYSYLISDSWKTAKECSTVTNTTTPEYVYSIPFPKTGKASAPYYNILKLVHNGVDLVDAVVDTKRGAAPAIYTGYTSPLEQYSALNLVLELFHAKKRDDVPALRNFKGLYYETYKHLTKPGHLLLVSKINTGAASMVIDEMSYVANAADDLSLNTHNSVTPYRTVPSRQIKASEIDTVLVTPFYSPLPTSPITLLEGTRIRVYSHGSYIVNKGSLTYIRKPQKIDLRLQRNCELAPEFHQYIVDRAVEYAAGRVEQQGLNQVAAAENIRNK